MPVPNIQGITDGVRDIILCGLNCCLEVFPQSKMRGNRRRIGAPCAVCILRLNPLRCEKRTLSISV